MAKTQGIRAGRAFVELGVSDKLTAGLKRARARLQAFGATLRGIGTRFSLLGVSILAPLAKAVSAFKSTGDSIAKMARRTGVSVEALSEMGFAAEQSGSSLETLEGGLRRMQRTVGDAISGMQSAKDALAALGVSADMLQGLSPEQQFKVMADGLSRIEDPTLRAAAAMEVFGRSGTQLLPLVADGAKGIEELQQQARDFGLTITSDMGASAERLTDTLNILWRVVKQGIFLVGAALGDSLVDMTRRITENVVVALEWIRANKQLIVSVAKIGVALLGAGALFIALGLAVSAIGSAFGLLAGVISVGSTVLTALLSPIGLTIAAIAALAAAVLLHSGAAGEALGWLREQFGRLAGWVSKVVSGISDALAAGDVALAARVLWLSLKQAWQEGAAALKIIWLELKRFTLVKMEEMRTGAVAASETLWHVLQVHTIAWIAAQKQRWNRFTSFWRLTWATLKNVAVKVWNELKGLFDETFDFEAANLAADQTLVAAEQRINQEKDARTRALQRERDDKLRAEVRLHEATLRQIVEAEDDALAKLDQQTAAHIADTRRKLDEARQALADALAEARRKREGLEGEDQAPVGGPRGAARDPVADLEDRLDGLGDVIADKITVTGTFNPAAIAGLAGSADAEQRTARATEQAVKLQRRLVDAAVTGGLTFT